MAHGGIKEISLSGGEPLLHPNILEIVKYCHDQGIYTTLYTSGIVENTAEPKSNDDREFSAIAVARLFTKLKQAGLDKVVFDLQAATERVYNTLMGTQSNFYDLLQLVFDAARLDWETAVHFVPNQFNTAQFKMVYQLAEAAGINEVRVLKFVPQGRGRENQAVLQLANRKLSKFIKQCSNIEAKKTKLKIGIPLRQQNAHQCTAGFDKIDIRYDGQILPCPAFKDTDIKLLQAKGFKAINIYENLEDFDFTVGGSRKTPLCEQIMQEQGV